MNARHYVGVVSVVLIAIAVGWWARGLLPSAPGGHADVGASSDGPCPGGVAPLYWKAPMDPTYVRDAPGKSPMGMDLVPQCPSGRGVPAGSDVVLDASTVQNIGVRTQPVERRDLVRTVRAAGRVAYDERRVAHVHTKVQGWVETLHVDFIGKEVERGERLLEIYSPELVATQEELLLAARYRSSTGESPFEDVRVGGESLLAATRRRLTLWDVPQRDIDRLLETGEVKRTLTLYAPTSGVVTQLGVRSGMEVRPNANLYTIADLSRVWVIADVYEFELPWLALGQRATVELTSLPSEPMEGVLTYISPFLDPKTRTAEVRLELDNASGRLKPEMFGIAVISGSPQRDVLVVPSDAVIRSGTRAVAIVALGDGRFEPRDVALGLDSGDGWVEIRSGLREDEDVVVSSQFLIDSESKLQEAVQKLLAAGDPEGEDASPDEPSQHGEHVMPAEPAMDHSMHGTEAPDHGEHVMPAEPAMDHSMHEDPAPPPPVHDHSAMGEE